MRRRLVLLNEELAAEAAASGEEFVPLKMGIGLNTGMCCVGNMGSQQRFDYSALGDEVNLASRLEGQTKLYGVDIIMSNRTHEQAGDFTAAELDRVAVVGKTVPVTIFALLGDGALGGEPDVRAALVLHDAMLRAYRRQEWDRAEARLRDCRALLEDHGDLGRYYALIDRRIANFRRDPPGEDWDGVYRATGK
jgi:adenylate cyclase